MNHPSTASLKPEYILFYKSDPQYRETRPVPSSTFSLDFLTCDPSLIIGCAPCVLRDRSTIPDIHHVNSIVWSFSTKPSPKFSMEAAASLGRYMLG